MKKNIKIICLIIILIVFIVGIYICLNRMNNVSKNNKSQEIYNTIYYFGFGSRRVKVYENGDVYDDVEIESPNHEIDYKFVKTLSKEQLNKFKKKMDNNSSKDELDNYIIEEVYGVKKFGNHGEY